MTLMADEGGMKQMKENPMDDAKIAVPKGVSASGVKADPVFYKRSSLASIKVEDDCCCFMANWVLDHRRMSTAGKGSLHNRVPSENQVVLTARQRGMSVS